jgi:hypothetical protein
MDLLLVAQVCFVLAILSAVALVYVVFHEPLDSARARQNDRRE